MLERITFATRESNCAGRPARRGSDRDDDEFLFRGKKGNGVEWNEDGEREEAGGGFVNFYVNI